MNAPVSPAIDPQQIEALIAPLRDLPGAMLPVLHALQDAFGHVPPAAVPLIASALHRSRAEVHGVITYYHHFRTTPPGQHTVHVCRAEACQARGAEALFSHIETRLGCERHSTRADGAVSLEPAYCLGLCASGPAIMIDEQPHARVTPERFDALAVRHDLISAESAQ